jgi:hypothetical protein
MAHFVKVVDGVVVDGVAIVNDALEYNGEFPESEPSGQKFLEELGLGNGWFQTSYNANFRGNYAGIGFTYNSELDAFIPPKQYESWILNENTYRWEAPIPKPDNTNNYRWNEATISWILAD